MMEENNRKGPGIFYAVVGVATLVVAIIGATFAYFSAQASAGEGVLEGETLDLSGAALTMDVERYAFTGATVTNKNLVPAIMTADDAGVQAALTASCENAGYTGCHVYRITAGTTENVTAATVTLDLSVTSDNASDWKYALFTATDSDTNMSEDDKADGSLTGAALLKTIPTGKTATGDLGTALSIDLNSNGTTSLGLVGETNKVVYLMVYLADDGSVQNEEDANNAEGSYSGTVTLNAGSDGGKVVATFTASQAG